MLSKIFHFITQQLATITFTVTFIVVLWSPFEYTCGSRTSVSFRNRSPHNLSNVMSHTFKRHKYCKEKPTGNVVLNDLVSVNIATPGELINWSGLTQLVYLINH